MRPGRPGDGARPALAARDLVKRFGDLAAVDGVDSAFNGGQSARAGRLVGGRLKPTSFAQMARLGLACRFD